MEFISGFMGGVKNAYYNITIASSPPSHVGLQNHKTLALGVLPMVCSLVYEDTINFYTKPFYLPQTQCSCRYVDHRQRPAAAVLRLLLHHPLGV